MPFSLQQIEAALAHVQLPVSQRNSQGRAAYRENAEPFVAEGIRDGKVSCSFDLGRDFVKPTAASSLAGIEPPQFCKPLRRVVSEAPLQSISMVVNPVSAVAAVADSIPAPTSAIADMLPTPEPVSETTEASKVAEASEVAEVAEVAETVEAVASAAEVIAPTEVVSSEIAQTVGLVSETDPSLSAESGAGLETEAQDIATPGVTPLKVRNIEEVESPELPRAKMPEFKTHRNHSNPMLPLGLLQDIGKEVVSWQTQLKTVHDSIQALYDEGPIVNAWLESVAGSTQANIKGKNLDGGQSEAVRAAPDLMMAGRYCVCGLDKAGQVWRKLCPPEQLPQVSMAIARHQKLRQLLNQKQSIDGRLQRLAQTLTVLRGHLRAY